MRPLRLKPRRYAVRPDAAIDMGQIHAQCVSGALTLMPL